MLALASPDVPIDPVLKNKAEARKLKRKRALARAADALGRRPELRQDRLGPIQDVLRWYRDPPDRSVLLGPLGRRLEELRHEVEQLEAEVARLPHRAHLEGDAIRRALTFLRGFARVTTLDYEPVPPEERSKLIALLALEYRWCFAAAETTPRAFKIAIGRTGAR
jgi:hypothetical protein